MRFRTRPVILVQKGYNFCDIFVVIKTVAP